GTLDSTDGGINTLASGGTMAISGTLRAIDGSNAIKFLNTQPTITGQVTPAATVTQDAALNPCPGPSGVCGDGNVDPGEQCDDGNQVNGDGCDNNCTFPGCGNGVKDPGEECDDGNMIPGDGCSPTCKTERCGNGELDPGEQCDDGPTGSASCSPQCMLIPPPTRGNGVIHPGETCDDRNKTACDRRSSIF